MELSSPKLKNLLDFFQKNFLIFQERTCKDQKTKISYISPEKVPPKILGWLLMKP